MELGRYDMDLLSDRITISTTFLKRRFDEARDTLYAIKITNLIYEQTGISEIIPLSIKTFGDSSLTQMVISICSFFEGVNHRRMNNSIRTFIEYLDRNIQEVKKEYKITFNLKNTLNEHREIISEHKEIIDRFYTYRNKMSGHTDLKYLTDFNKIKDDIEFVFAHINELVDVMETLISFYVELFLNQKFDVSPLKKELMSLFE